MAIKINDIPPEGLTLKIAESLDILGEGGPAAACTATLGIKPLGGSMLQITGRAQAQPLLECSRCLLRFPFPIEAEFDFELAPTASLAEGEEHELEPTELDREFYEGDEIDPAEIIREQLLLGIPMVPIHSAECKGLCPVCGTDLNAKDCGCLKDQGEAAGPFSILKDLFRKK